MVTTGKKGDSYIFRVFYICVAMMVSRSGTEKTENGKHGGISFGKFTF